MLGVVGVRLVHERRYVIHEDDDGQMHSLYIYVDGNDSKEVEVHAWKSCKIINGGDGKMFQ